jgi:hypothetical protein
MTLPTVLVVRASPIRPEEMPTAERCSLVQAEYVTGLRVDLRVTDAHDAWAEASLKSATASTRRRLRWQKW